MIWRYCVSGRVRDDVGAPLPGLRVRAWDKDLIFDDYLGEDTTDAEGCFRIEFTDEAFRSIVDENPDLYLRIFDADVGQELHTTRDRIRRGAGAEEHYEIEIPRARLAASS
ncbi:MAG: hypothetical protein QNK05_08180 [Myxococcota bacterium]|nr:hypothetical protein [Myxococcota bacterium]